jgi:alpha-L-fucosidase
MIRLARTILMAAAGLAMFPTTGSAQTPTVEPDRRAVYTPSKANLEAREWFQDAKFGVFLHWGIYSQLGGVGSPGVAEWIMNDRQIPARKYERLAQFFNPTQFDADRWVRDFKAAGARYIVITSKHHDGFAMFDSKVSDYDVVESTPFKRDPIKELAEACRRHGVKLFFYYSQLDWHHPDYFPRGHTGLYAGRPEKGDWQRYLDYQNAQIRELLTQYGPIGGFWFDGWWDQERGAYRERWQLQRTYDMIHRLQPSALIVNNHHQAPFPGEDYQAFERDLPGENSMGFNGAEIGQLPIEMAETMNGSWGFSLLDDNYKSTEQLLRTMVGAAGRNANFLLNTGPMPNGRIQPENLKSFAEIGEWLKVYGPSIYNTRAGPVAPRSWGVTTIARDGTIYLHVLDWKDAPLFVPVTTPVSAATMVSGGSAVPFRKVAGGVELTLAPAKAGEWDRVIALRP